MVTHDKYRIILGSKSPRRQELLRQITAHTEVRIQDVDEVYDPAMPVEDVPGYLASIKAEALLDGLAEDELILTADTVVILEGEILGKPVDEADACAMLRRLSGKTHTVVTGCCLQQQQRREVFSVHTDVHFRTLTEDEITYYVRTYKPLDKAGSYGIQEYIGMIGVEWINGSFYNVMGLPVAQLCEALKNFG